MSAKKIIFIVFIFFLTSFLCAEILNSSTWGYSVDLPEGFILSDKRGNDSFLFEHSEFPASVIIKAYSKNRFSSSSDALTTVMEQLYADYESFETDWNYNDCVLSYFEFIMNDTYNCGWGISSTLKDDDGYIVMLAYAPDSNFDATCEQFLFSCLDSLCIEDGDFYSAGPITSFAYPKTEKVTYSTIIANKEIKFSLDADATEADSFVVEREYAVLKLYAQSELWQQAWARYYRQIFRNACGLVRESAFQIYTELAKIAKSDEDICQLLLSWAQGFSYEREVTESDFTPITAAMIGIGSDCDSRSLMLATLLYHMNFKTCIFVSAQFSHAMLGVALDKKGAKINVEGINYLMGETTTKVDIGLIDASMNNTNMWMPVILY